MAPEKAATILSRLQGNIPAAQLPAAQQMLEGANDSKFLAAQQFPLKSPGTGFVLALLLGGLGVDRFWLGQTGAGILKLVTGGGFGVWWFIDLFLIWEATRRQNYQRIIPLLG